MSSSSKDIVPVLDIIPGTSMIPGAIVVLRDGSARMLLRAGAVNYDMRSEDEQEIITFGFGEMLNSLTPDFPVQIVVHTKNLDTQMYLSQFEERLNDPDLPAHIRALLADHMRHFQSQASTQNLLQREFYVVIPFGVDPDPVGERPSDSVPFLGMFKALASSVAKEDIGAFDESQLKFIRQQLDMRANQVAGFLGRIDISTHRLSDSQARALFYEWFNPSLSTRQRLRSVPLSSDGQMFGTRRATKHGESEHRRRALPPARPALTAGNRPTATAPRRNSTPTPSAPPLEPTVTDPEPRVARPLTSTETMRRTRPAAGGAHDGPPPLR